MIESVQVRQRGAFDFETHYDNLCALQDSCPLPAVKAHLSQGVLDLNGDRIRANDWMPILNTLRINKSLEFVAVRSYYTPSSDDNEKKALIEKRKTPSVRSKEITYRMCKALKECLGVTPTLTCLELQGLPLRERDLNTLMKGLVKNNTLSHFSLEFCRIGDTGLDILCKGMKNSASINSVNFTGCSLSWKGADSLAKVIKHQAMRRHNEAWRDSLRYRRPDLDRMPGIRRITINNNPMMGDQGAVLLAEALKDDLWLKALDMQGNGISSTGAKSLLDVLKYNTTLVVLDVRRNPLIDRDLVHAIMEQLMINCNGQDTEYKWIKAEESGDVKGRTPKKRTKTLNSSFGRKTTIRITAGAARRRTRSAESIGVSRKMKPISSEGVKAGPGMPWRTAARANRYRGYPPEHIPGQSSLLENSENLSPHGTPNQSGVTVTMEGSEGSEGEEDEDTIGELQKLKLDDSALTTQVNSQKNLRIEVQQLRRQMQEERLARHKAEQRVVELTLDNKKVREENSRLKRTKGSILDDDSVLESIEASFKQFHEFLDLLRDAGLGQLITMAGLDAKGSPFVQQQPSSKFDADPNANFPKTNGKSQVFLGDISGSSRINGSFVGSGKAMNGNLRTKSYFNSNDGTMSSFLDDSNDNLKARHDDLYERILERTNGVFNPDVTVDVTVDSTRTADDDDNNRLNETDENVKKDEKTMKGKEISVGKNLAVLESYDSLRGPGGEIIMSLSPFEDEEEEKQGKVNQNGKKDDISERVDSPDKGQGRTSRVSDFSYGMDSFEQSYISERGEVVHLGDDVDFYPESPSPIGQASDEEDF